MTLAAGTRLGSYEIVASIGAGGMGEVYKARDVRLERTVAIKIVPETLSSSPEVRQRFEREAKTISQLSHPHICALYDVGREGDVEYLVMEFLEGETLADRLARGALPLEQTLRYGGEIADALDRAHRQAIVHRDLKPGNVMLTKSGVKLLDFGLAKALPAARGGEGLTALPTQANLTQEGTILGTFQYMAPEQLEGKEADARTDLFALGAVLYEMATGKKAFPASSQASLITAIMSSSPAAISTLQPMSPPALDRVVSTCLAKDPEERWQSAHDVASELRWIATGSGSASAVPGTARRPTGGSRLAWIAAGAFFVGMTAFAVAFLRRPAAPVPPAVRFQVPLSEGSDVSSGLAVSPDGTRIAFIATTPGASRALWIRALDSVQARPLPGTEEATQPFWSPDGRFVGFFANSSLKTIDVAAELTKTVCAVSTDPRGGAWLPDGTILFAPSFQSPLMRVAAQGGTPVPASKLDASRKEQTHRWPSALPDGRHFLYYASKGSGEEPGEIWVGSLDGSLGKHLFTSQSMAVFASPGFLLFDSGRNLVAQPFDPRRLELSGEPRPISGQLSRITEQSGFRPFAASPSASGVIAFQSGTGVRTSRLVWLDRDGKELSTIAEGLYYAPRLSRDGAHIAIARWDQTTTIGDIWLFEIARNVASRFTFDPADESNCTWTPDGQRVIFGSSRDGVMNLYQARADRSGGDQLLLRSDIFKSPDDVSPDGQNLVYETFQGNAISLWVLPLTGTPTPKPLGGSTPGYAAHFSPDGRWLAYTSVESGRDEVYVTAFPGPGGRWQVSVNGGKTARWRADGRELFFYGLDGNLMSVDVKTEPTFEAGVPRPLFKVRLQSSPDRQYEVSPDGKRFLANVAAGSRETPPLTVVVGWAGPSKQ